jgi:hypothetical protein
MKIPERFQMNGKNFDENSGEFERYRGNFDGNLKIQVNFMGILDSC